MPCPSLLPVWSLHPRPGYVPMVLINLVQSIVLHPPPQSADLEKLHLVCPVRAPEHRCIDLGFQSDQLLVCFGSRKKGSLASKQTISKWIVEAVSTAYEARSMYSPLLIRAHSTRTVVSSKALLSGVSFQEFCYAAS